MTDKEHNVKEIMDAQADLQVAIGFLRLDMKNDSHKNSDFVEDRAVRALARLHKLLDRMGNPMYQPSTHPEVK